MRVRHYPSVDSDMARYWRGSDQFEVYNDQGAVVLVLTGDQLMAWIAAQAAQAQIVIDLAKAVYDKCDLFPKRQLIGRHKPLKTLPTSPHVT